MATEVKKEKKPFNMPHVDIILGSLLVVATILTYIIPAGQYDFIQVNGKNVIDAASFHYVDQTPVGPWQMIMDIPQACVNAAMLIFCSFLISGAIKVINSTGALDATIGRVAHAAKNKLAIAVPLVMAPFVILGAMGITEPNNVAFIPLGLMVASAFGADAIAGTAIIMFAISAGFTMAPFGTATTANAQTIAGLPIYSGWGLRTIGVLLFWALNAWYVMRYIAKVQKNPQSSLCLNDPNVVRFEGEFKAVELTTRRILITIVFGLMFAAIFKFAFGVKAVAGGAAGIAISQVITQGCKRGVFSNEAGLGSSVMVHSSSNVKEPVKQGIWGIFEVFFDTFVVCTMTAIVVLSSGHIDLNTGLVREGVSDATLVAQVFGESFGFFGEIFIAIAMLLFAFTTVLGWSQYGTKAVEYLFGTKATMVYKVIFVLMIISGAVMTSSLAWDISDTFNGLMMIPNLIGVVALFPLVSRITKNYVRRNIKNENVAPILSYDPAIEQEMCEALKQELAETAGE